LHIRMNMRALGADSYAEHRTTSASTILFLSSPFAIERSTSHINDNPINSALSTSPRCPALPRDEMKITSNPTLTKHEHERHGLASRPTVSEVAGQPNPPLHSTSNSPPDRSLVDFDPSLRVTSRLLAPTCQENTLLRSPLRVALCARDSVAHSYTYLSDGVVWITNNCKH
jgi:hypothetical protein